MQLQLGSDLELLADVLGRLVGIELVDDSEHASFDLSTTLVPQPLPGVLVVTRRWLCSRLARSQ